MLGEITFVTKHAQPVEALQQAQSYYNAFFKDWHPYIQRVTEALLRELYTIEDQVGYLVRITIEGDENVMKRIEQWIAQHYWTVTVPNLQLRLL